MEPLLILDQRLDLLLGFQVQSTQHETHRRVRRVEGAPPRALRSRGSRFVGLAMTPRSSVFCDGVGIMARVCAHAIIVRGHVLLGSVQVYSGRGSRSPAVEGDWDLRLHAQRTLLSALIPTMVSPMTPAWRKLSDTNPRRLP